MTEPLSPVRLSPASGWRRESPRPPDLRNARYAAEFDWDTLFYDVYRAGRFVVLQGPPLFNLLAPLQQSAPFAGAFKGFRPKARHVGRDKRGEIWLRSDAEHLVLDGPLGHYRIAVQPDGASVFAGRRVLTTLSKDNPERWIRDWITFYRREHGAEAVLLYDNASTSYAAADLEAELTRAFPDLVVRVVAWNYPYGPQGGLAGAVEGRETPWDSDFCQTGSLQHARLRYLRHASSVLNVDIDELLVPVAGHSIFETTERSRHGFIKFPGRWVSNATPEPVDGEGSRHADFVWLDRAETRSCPPKWCLVPAEAPPFSTSWSVHNLFGAKANRKVDQTFIYRHMMGISNSWKEQRSQAKAFDPAGFEYDAALAESLQRAGFGRAGLTR